MTSKVSRGQYQWGYSIDYKGFPVCMCSIVAIFLLLPS